MECFQQIYDELHSMPENQYNDDIGENICVEIYREQNLEEKNEKKHALKTTQTRTHVFVHKNK